MITEENLRAVFTADDGEHTEIPIICWESNVAMVASRTGTLVAANQQPGFLGLWDPPGECRQPQYAAAFKKLFGVKGVFKGSRGMFMRVVRFLP